MLIAITLGWCDYWCFCFLLYVYVCVYVCTIYIYTISVYRFKFFQNEYILFSLIENEIE